MSNKNFKVGDQVRVKNDLEINKCYGNWLFNDDMVCFKDKIVTIDSIFKNGVYSIKEDKNWYYSDEMLESVEQQIKKDEFRIDITNTKSLIGRKFKVIYKDILAIMFNDKNSEHNITSITGIMDHFSNNKLAINSSNKGYCIISLDSILQMEEKF